MKALSIRQPWAWLIIGGFPIFESVVNEDGSTRVEWHNKVIYKDIENRSKPTSFRGRTMVHAGKSEDPKALDWLLSHGFPAIISLMSFSKRLPRGAIIGEVDIVDCVAKSNNLWFIGPYGYVLANPTAYEKAIPYKGASGFFEPEIQTTRGCGC